MIKRLFKTKKAKNGKMFGLSAKKRKAIVKKATSNANKVQMKILKKAGYKVYRFWEHDINNSFDNVKKKIKIYANI